MDLVQLEHFLAVVDEGTFTRAAERVSRTQPAVSQSIKKLEDVVGAPLFARDLNDVALTEHGRLLVDYARRIVGLRDDALKQMAELRSLRTGTLTVAAHETAAVYLLPAALNTYLQRFPDIRIEVQTSPLAQIPRKVMDREVDIGFVKDDVAFHELRAVEVHRDELVCIAPPLHPLAGRGAVSVRDLGDQRFVMHHRCTTTRDAVLRLFDHHAVRCRIGAELWSFESIKGFVREGIGLAFVPGITVRRELNDGALARIPVREFDIPRRTQMIYRDPGYLSDSARALITIVRALAEQRTSAASPVSLAEGRSLRRRA
jgi:DNA-binding transcriptional LysR family regulator